jgi:hypothetical protein
LTIVTEAKQNPSSVLTPTSSGQVNVGATSSGTVTAKEQVAVFPERSVKEYVTVVVPTGKASPELWLLHSVRSTGSSQLSVAVADGGSQVTVAVHKPPVGETVMLVGGQSAIVGGWLSFTVTVCTQDAEFPESSVAVQVIVVTPCGKGSVRESGSSLRIPVMVMLEVGEQLSVAVAGTVISVSVKQTLRSVESTRSSGQVMAGG